MEEKQQYDLDKVYTYKELPDKNAGRCDNCDYSNFHLSMKNGLYLRECKKCGMKKSI